MQNIPLALTYDDVLLVPQYSEIKSRQDVDLKTRITPSLEIDFPLISINMDTVTGVDMAIAMSNYGALSFYPRFQQPKDQLKDIQKVLKKAKNVVPAIGIKEGEFERAKLLYENGIKIITIDVAHGHLKSSLDMVKKLKKTFKGLEVIAGVVATYEGARDLFEAGADAVRVGVGPGTVCTTRVVTGFGVPQITAVLEASRAGKEFKRPIISDGGTKTTGDIVKVLAAGANAVVTGSQLAGTKESPGEAIEINGTLHKPYNGSTSKTEKVKQYMQNPKDKSSFYVEYVEGVEAFVPYKGTVADVLGKMEKGIRSAYSYCGARNIDELHKKAKFIQVTTAGVSESGAHGVVIKS